MTISKKAAISPNSLPSNRFVDLFSNSINLNGIKTGDFLWNIDVLTSHNYYIFHWPSDFFCDDGFRGFVRNLFEMSYITIAKRIFGVKVFWVAHNVSPHDRVLSKFWPMKFLRSLNGVIYLSRASKTEVEAAYPYIKDVASLVTTHGHYLEVAKKQPTPARALCRKDRVNLAFVGQVRPYKGIEDLIGAISQNSQNQARYKCTVAGKCPDPAFLSKLTSVGKNMEALELKIGPQILDDEAYEQEIDNSDALVFPYRNILNSGSVIMALSRWRPILAPDTPVLREIRDVVGFDWIYLYENTIDSAILDKFCDWLVEREPSNINLQPFEWLNIGEQICSFLESAGNPQKPAAQNGEG